MDNISSLLFNWNSDGEFSLEIFYEIYFVGNFQQNYWRTKKKLFWQFRGKVDTHYLQTKLVVEKYK